MTDDGIERWLAAEFVPAPVPDGLAGAGDMHAALVRNLYRGEAPPADAVAHVRHGLAALRRALDDVSIAAMMRGELP